MSELIKYDIVHDVFREGGVIVIKKKCAKLSGFCLGLETQEACRLSQSQDKYRSSSVNRVSIYNKSGWNVHVQCDSCLLRKCHPGTNVEELNKWKPAGVLKGTMKYNQAEMSPSASQEFLPCYSLADMWRSNCCLGQEGGSVEVGVGGSSCPATSVLLITGLLHLSSPCRSKDLRFTPCFLDLLAHGGGWSSRGGDGWKARKLQDVVGQGQQHPFTLSVPAGPFTLICLDGCPLSGAQNYEKSWLRCRLCLSCLHLGQRYRDVKGRMKRRRRELQMSPIRGDLIKNDRGWCWRVQPHMRGIWVQWKQVPMIYNSSNAPHSF